MHFYIPSLFCHVAHQKWSVGMLHCIVLNVGNLFQSGIPTYTCTVFWEHFHYFWCYLLEEEVFNSTSSLSSSFVKNFMCWICGMQGRDMLIMWKKWTVCRSQRMVFFIQLLSQASMTPSFKYSKRIFIRSRLKRVPRRLQVRRQLIHVFHWSAQHGRTIIGGLKEFCKEICVSNASWEYLYVYILWPVSCQIQVLVVIIKQCFTV